MIFNGDADNQDLCTLADAKAKSNDVSFPLWKKAMYANMKSREVWRRIWNAYGGWIEDDHNNSGEPEVLTNLVTTSRNLYAFASAQFISAVEWLDAAGNWWPLTKITLEEIQDRGYAETDFMNTAGLPQYYRPTQNGIRIYPDSDAARSNALKAKIRRDIVAFTSASTTATPGWDSLLHEGLAVGMAHEYAKDEALATAGTLGADWATFLDQVGSHYQKKFLQNFPPDIKHRRDVAGAYVS